MSQLIIIRGPAGVGKTTIAKILANKLSAKYISLDELLHKHGLAKMSGICIKEENFFKVNEEAIPEAIKTLEIEKQNVIMDGNFYHINYLKILLEKIPFPNKVFTLKASVENCIKRDAPRKGKAKIGEDNIRQVHDLVSRFDYGTIIQTEGKTPQQVAEEIISYC